MLPDETNGHRVLTNGHRPAISTREQAKAEALVLSREGHGVRAIAEALTARGWKVGKTAAAELVNEAQREEPFIDLLDRAQGRVDQANRLQMYLQILLGDMRSGLLHGHEFVERMRWIEERWAKLGGLDAPAAARVQMEVTEHRAPTFESLDALREALSQRTGSSHLQWDYGVEEQAAELIAREDIARMEPKMAIDTRHEELHEDRDASYAAISPPCVDYTCPLFREAYREVTGSDLA